MAADSGEWIARVHRYYMSRASYAAQSSAQALASTLTSQFCLALGGGGYLLAAQYTNSDTEAWSQKLGAGKWWRRGQEQPSDREITRAKVLEEAKVCRGTLVQTIADP
jgi:hypothetical protein